MNKNDYKKLELVKADNRVISPDDLKNKSDRTLLYGYSTYAYGNLTWHVYIKDEVIHTIWYDNTEEEITICELPNYINNKQYIPNKRLYPEYCDFEFCELLKQRGIQLPFSQWTNDNMEEKQYYALLNK